MSTAPARIDFVSTGRADFSNHAAILDALDPSRVRARVVLAGDFSLTRDEAVARVGESQVCVVDPGDVPHDVAAAKILTGYNAALEEGVDAVVLVGDRWELLPVVTAAVLKRVPLVHVCGGELTLGALDEQVRHAVTKAAHLHCVAHASFAARLQRMGEAPWRVHITGDPGIDVVRAGPRADRAELAAMLEVPIDRRTVVVALHPVTNAPDEALDLWAMSARALAEHDGAVVVTGPNRDPGADGLRAVMSRDCAARPGRWRYVEHLGSRRFLGLLAEAGALLGNSSAGIWESPALGALSINLGGRQEGRLRSAYTLDVTAGDFTGLRCALDAALGDAYRERVRGAPNPYGDGHAAPRVAELLAALPARDVLLRKRFYDGGGDAV